MNENIVRVRFAPSPTGYLHIGGARTALFNWMYAKAQGGKFILRIEDTDLERSKQEYLDEILKSMTWLGLKWDELYRQSDRFTIYRDHAEKLLAADKAYKDGAAVILKAENQGIKLFDLIRGEIGFEAEVMKDEVLMKSDGSPTYSFACVIDDSLMQISHVIRGEDHISNTPKQIMMYNAFGWKPPKFAHLPLIMDAEGGRLSKRTGAVAVTDYKKAGFLPEAIVNYLMLLGWSPGENQEIVGLDAAVKKFSIKKINKAAAVFSMDKLKWINAQYIKQKSEGGLADLLVPFLKEQGLIGAEYDRSRIEAIAKLYKSRMATLAEFAERAQYLFGAQVDIAPELRQKYLTEDKYGAFQRLAGRLGAVENFDKVSTETAFKTTVAEAGITMSDLVHPVRVALTGSDIGPGLFETMELLGKEKTIRRLQEAAGRG